MEGSGRRGMSRVSGAPEEKRNAKKKNTFHFNSISFYL